MILLLAACTFEPGLGFTTLTEVRIRPIVEDDLVLDIGPLRLQELEGGGTFDPANPPPGFSLCHNGHCHAEDGSLPTYAEVEAILLGDQASWRTVASIPIGEIDGPTVIEPDEALPMADIGHLTLPVRLDGQEVLAEGGLALTVDRSTAPEVAIDVEVVVVSVDPLEVTVSGEAEEL